MDNIPLWLALVTSLAIGALVAVSVRVFLVPYYKRRLVAPPVNFSLGLSNGEGSNQEPDRIFHYLFTFSRLYVSYEGGATNTDK